MSAAAARVRYTSDLGHLMLAGRRVLAARTDFATEATLDRYLAAAHDDPYAVRSPGGAPYVSDAYADDFEGYYRAIELEGAL